MEIAISEARNALRRGEVPVGCALVRTDGTLVCVGSNRTNERGNATSHAELVAFEVLGDGQKFERGELTLYVTCEPCVMCASAIVQYGIIGKIVFGCANPRFGGCGSVRSLDMYREILKRDGCGSQMYIPDVVKGVEAKRCVELLGEFYRNVNPHAPKPKKRRVKG